MKNNLKVARSSTLWAFSFMAFLREVPTSLTIKSQRLEGFALDIANSLYYLSRNFWEKGSSDNDTFNTAKSLWNTHLGER